MTIDISFKERLEFDGYLVSDGGDIPISNIVIIRKKYLYLDDITFQAQTSKEYMETISNSLRSSGSTLSLKGTLWNKSDVFAKVFIQKISKSLLTGFITELEIVKTLPSEIPEHQYLYAHLSSTDLALSSIKDLVFHYTGEIKSFDNNTYESPCFTFNTELGLATLEKHYSFEDDESHDADIDIRISQVTISIELNNKSRNNDQNNLFNKFKECLIPIEFILSFLSRRQVRWYELVLVSDRLPNNSEVFESRVIQQGFSTPKPYYSLVHPFRVSMPDSLNEIVKNFIDLPFRESIEHTINYLNAQWKDSTIETRASASFTAFETIINGISKHQGNQEIINEKHFKHLRKNVEKTIKSYCIENHLDREIRGNLYKKVNELRMSPIVSRAVNIIQEYEISHKDIIGETPIETWLRTTYHKRSLFIHTGKIDDYSSFSIESDRIHALTERIIYKLIGGSADWLDPGAYRYIPIEH